MSLARNDSERWVVIDANLELDGSASIVDSNAPGRRMLQRDEPKLFKMKPKPLYGLGVWSLLSPTYRNEAGITNKRGAIRQQGRVGSCAATSAASIQSWYEGVEKSGLWIYAHHLMGEGKWPTDGGSRMNALIGAEIAGGSPSEDDFKVGDPQLDAWPLGITEDLVNEAMSKATQPSFKSTKESPYVWHFKPEVYPTKPSDEIWNFLSSSIWHGIPLWFGSSSGYYLQINRDSPLQFPGIYSKPSKSTVKSGHAMYITGVGIFPSDKVMDFDLDRDKTVDPRKNPGEYKPGPKLLEAEKWLKDKFTRMKKGKDLPEGIKTLTEFEEWVWNHDLPYLVKEMQEDYVERKLPPDKLHGLSTLAQKILYAYHGRVKVTGITKFGKEFYARVQLGSDPDNVIWIENKLVPFDLEGEKSNRKHRSEPAFVMVKDLDTGDQVLLEEHLETKVISQADWFRKNNNRYITRHKYVQVVNSWGTKFGYEGQVWIPYEEWYKAWLEGGDKALFGFAEVTRPAEIVNDDIPDDEPDDEFDDDEFDDDEDEDWEEDQ